MTQPDLSNILAQFKVEGDFLSASPYGSGHINDTYAATFQQSGQTVRYILQRVNRHVFLDVPGLMKNVERICEHAKVSLKAQGCEDILRRSMTLIPTLEGASYHVDEAGDFWRVYVFIEGATGHDAVTNEKQAYNAAKAFGEFQALLADLPGERLNETIPDFHNTPSRFDAFQRALKADKLRRARDVMEEVGFVAERKALAHSLVNMLKNGDLPERVTHNDAKLNNVLIDDATDEAICVIDLDTLMPGLAAYDFGDLVRTCTCSAPEDTTDLSSVSMEMNMFSALARGFIDSARDVLTPTEIQTLPLGGKVLTFECGMRFLTDYLEGDSYFKVSHPTQNLDRCRSQFARLVSMEQQESEMMEEVESLWKK